MNAKTQLNTLAPSMKEAERMLDMLDAGGEFTFQTFDDAGKSKNLAHICHGSLEANFETLARLNSQGAGVFVTVNQTDLQGRTSDNVTRVRALWVDFDTVDHARLDRLMNMDGIPPNLIVESSPDKHHAYWIIDENGEIPLNQFTELQKRLIHHFADDGADKAIHDLPRVMRLTGFYHRKGEAFMARVVHSDEWRDAADLIRWVQSLPMPEVAKPKAQAEKPQTQKTQQTHSTLDFKQAKLLARGRWPEILNQLGYTLSATAPHEHVTCPMCGGSDRFRFDNENGDGSFICSQGTGEPIAGDGFTLLEHSGKSAAEALQAVNHALSAMGLVSKFDNKDSVHQWGEIIPLAQANATTATAYPIHAFPPIARDAIKQAAYYNHVPLALAGQTALGLMVYIAQEHAQAPSDKTSKGQPCSFGIFSVFESGGGKDETRNLLARSIADREKRDKAKYLADREYYYSLPAKERKEEPKPVNPITLYTKGTTQGIAKAMSRSVFSSFAWQTTEGAMILGGYSLTSDTMGESLGVINHLIDRGETSSILHGDDEPEIVIDKRFSVDLSIQDVMAKKALNNEALRLQGFLARFLFAAPEPLPIRKVTKEMRRIIASEDSAIIAFNELSERLKYPPHTEINPFSEGRTQFLKDDEADALHIDFENYIKEAADKGGKYHIIRPNALRMIQYSLRVATVLTYFTPELDSIDAKTMQGAIDLCTYSLDEWIRYYGKDEETDSDHMLKWLLKQKSSKVLKSSISTHATPQKLRNKNIRDDVLTTLCDCNYARLEKLGGKDYVVLNPSLTG